MIENLNECEAKHISELALQASNLRYDALARLIDELAEASIDKSWNLDMHSLIDAKEALEKAYILSLKYANSESLEKHPDSYDELRSEVMELESKDIHVFLKLLVKNSMTTPKKTFKKDTKNCAKSC